MLRVGFYFEGYKIVRILYHFNRYVSECSWQELNSGECVCIIKSNWGEVKRAKGIDLEPTQEKWIF